MATTLHHPDDPRHRTDVVARHDPYRHLRENLVQHRTMAGFRTVKLYCDVCQVFEPDDSGRCPLCQPEAPGNLVDELRAQRGPADLRGPGHGPGLRSALEDGVA